jgi:hypothetical protein
MKEGTMKPESKTMKPDVSVVIVSDYAAGGAKTWNDLRRLFNALSKQDYKGQAEFLLCENADLNGKIPLDLVDLLPGLRMVLVEESASYELKNAGMQAARADLAVILDADCVPDSDWLRMLVNAMNANPEASVISGKTVYAGQGLGERMLSILSRSYVDTGQAGVTRFISNNNAAWRRAVYLAHPLPANLGPFAGRMQSESIRRAGGQLLFEPRMRVVHDFEGWPMEVDIRRNCGYGTVIARLHDRALPFAWLTSLGVFSIPAFVVGKTMESWRDCLRCARGYGIRWHEIPVVLACSIVVHALEARGMWLAFRGMTTMETKYR